MKQISVRMENEMLDKLHVIADYEGRSANAQVVYMIRKLVEEFEREHGEIEIGQSVK